MPETPDNTTADEQLPSLSSPLGRDALAYRARTHSGFKAAMAAALGRDPALRSLTHGDTDDPTLALMDAWAATLDVLTFYQERIANEGYMRTAGERRSLQELARAVGYQLNPGVAAATHLAFTLEEGAGAPAKVLIEPGVKVQSVPGPGEQAQIFETVEQIEARPEWNALRPQMSERHIPIMDDTEVYLCGTNTGLKPGDGLLLVGRERAGDPQEGRSPRPHDDHWDFRRITTVEPDMTNGRTRVTWGEKLGWRRAGKTIHPAAKPQVYAFRLRAALFGHNATDWRAMGKAAQSKYPFAPSSGAGTSADGWPNFTITAVSGQPDVIHLDAAYPQIRPDSWLVLSTPDYVELYGVEEAIEDARTCFNLSGKTTRVRLSGENLVRFDDKLREAVVFAQSEPIDIAEAPLPSQLPSAIDSYQQPINEGAAHLSLDRQVAGLAKGRSLLIAGDTADGAKCELVALSADPTLEGGRTAIAFTPPLTHSYRRDSVVIYANVARATHGETRHEVLGSGDATQPFQSLGLRQAPLTYTPAATASGGASTLALRVNDIEWVGRPALYGLGPRDRAYSVREGPDGRAIIQFGDGASGARPPSGAENITAHYRIGLGAAGNLGPGQLRVLLTRPLGVRGVSNPMPASGGADRDDPDDARQSAPRTVLTLDRIVTLRDYEDFARTFGGVAKARADWLWNGSRGVIFVTVVAADGGAVADSTLANLRAAIDRARDPAQNVCIETRAAQKFRVSARLVVQPEYRQEPVLAAAQAALRRAFSLKRRDFGQDVSESEILGLLQSTEGVAAADLVRPYPFANKLAWDSRQNRLVARLSYMADADIVGATLLILDDGPNAVTLRVVPDLSRPEQQGDAP